MSESVLPGTSAPYLARAGEGASYECGGHLVTIVARPEDTNGALEAAMISGPHGASMPAHRHARGHEALFVIDGTIDLTVGGHKVALTRGDYASIPADTPHGHAFRGHYTRALQWSVGGALTQFYAAIGHPTTHAAYVPGPVHPVNIAAADGDAADTHVVHGPPAAPGGAVKALPGSTVPYVLSAGEGERLLAGDQLFTFLSTQRETRGAFITLSTIGPAGDRIPNHFHERHTETFFCVDGRMTMWAEGRELALGPGDFLHVPPGTIHSYRLDAPFTRFVGLLSPGLFEPFFRAMCEPFGGYIFPPTPGPVRFDRVMQQMHTLDLKLVERPGPPPAH